MGDGGPVRGAADGCGRGDDACAVGRLLCLYLAVGAATAESFPPLGRRRRGVGADARRRVALRAAGLPAPARGGESSRLRYCAKICRADGFQWCRGTCRRRPVVRSPRNHHHRRRANRRGKGRRHSQPKRFGCRYRRQRLHSRARCGNASGKRAKLCVVVPTAEPPKGLECDNHRSNRRNLSSSNRHRTPSFKGPAGRHSRRGGKQPNSGGRSFGHFNHRPPRRQRRGACPSRSRRRPRQHAQFASTNEQRGHSDDR